MTNGVVVEAEPQSLVHCAFAVLGEHASTPKHTEAKFHFARICRVFIGPSKDFFMTLSKIAFASHRHDSQAFVHTTAAKFAVVRSDDSGPLLGIEIEAFPPEITWQDSLLALERLALD